MKVANVTATGGEEVSELSWQGTSNSQVPLGRTAHLVPALLAKDAATDSASALDQAKDSGG